MLARIVAAACCQSSIARSPFVRDRLVNSEIVHRSLNTLQKPSGQNKLLARRFPSEICIKRQIHPLLILAANNVAKVLAILTGRGFRKWWASLPPDKRKYFYRRLIENKKKVAIGSGVLVGTGSFYYLSHIQTTPVTNRKRFIAFNAEQIEKIAEYEYEMQYEQFKGKLHSMNHPYVRRVRAVAERLLEANRDIEEIFSKKWSVSVVNAPLQNAFVLPNGQIFVFSGMLGLCENDDQLGCVLAHEMAHSVLNHGAELISYAHLIDIFIIGLLAAIWAIMPTDGIAAVTHWFFNRVVDVILHLPYSRKLETEADVVGLELAAKACYDVRESTAFWAKMSLMTEVQEEIEMPEFLSTHPAHENRVESLEKIMQSALHRRIDCRCPPLPRQDPRVSVDVLRHQIYAAKRWREQIAKEGVVLIPVQR